jgi:hypothetical protein
MTLALLADLLPQLTNGSPAATEAADLLRRGAPGQEAARLDAHQGLLQRHLDHLTAVVAEVPEHSLRRLAADGGSFPLPDTGTDAPLDALAIRLRKGSVYGGRLAVALARLIEDAPRLVARQRLPLGRGFEVLLDERLQRRFALLPDRHGLLTLAYRHRNLILEEPDEGVAAIERDLGGLLTEQERAWLAVERRIATLRFVRDHKNEDGHIRWYVRRYARHGTVLDRLGVHGHWAICGPHETQALARLGTAAERVAEATTPGWHIVNAAAVPAEVLADEDPLRLRQKLRGLDQEGVAAREDLLIGSLTRPRARDGNSAGLPKREDPLLVRLVYVPSAIPHELGGVPEIGAAFLRDHLERIGARVDVVQLPCIEFERRLPELLDADIVGIGVYVHNRDDVADLVRQLREAGFRGRIVLGGPETRNIEAVQESIPGWDAIIRGEGEEVLPRVLEILECLDRGEAAAALELARTLRGVSLRYGNAVLLCDTATRNRAETIRCPLPFDWARDRIQRHVKMNFTRGCPYWCSFCPNHQGRAFTSGAVDELWRFTVLAVADDLPLPPKIEDNAARTIQERLGVHAPPRLRPALRLMGQSRLTAADLKAIIASLEPVIDSRIWSDAEQLEALVGLRHTLAAQFRQLGEGSVLPWRAKETWLVAKTAVLASRQLWRKEGSHAEQVRWLARPSPFTIETSEDNTLVNRKQIAAYLRRRKQFGLAGDFLFNPGQNTIQDLLRGPGRAEANEEYIALLADENPFAVALGADGTSNAILRQNQKPLYGVAGLLAVNKALGRHAREVVNNYILLTPETDLLEAVESFALFLLLPVPWRDYGGAINLRVIKEETTLATDEGLVFAPEDVGHHVPFRFPEVQRLLDRWGLTSEVPTRRLRPLLWRILENDVEVRALLPLLVRRWERNLDDDLEMAALAVLVGRELRTAESVAHALWRLVEHIQAEAFVDGRPVATFRDLVRRPSGHQADAPARKQQTPR